MWRNVSMCIVCTGSRWSRRLASAAPWLVVPILLVWGVTQFFPRGWRIEVTSPRVLCVITLLSLAWYELALPRLKDFRAKRKAELLERKRIQSLEEARWRKVATRRCRNCLAAYDKQTPPGGKFMCTYCGHVSRKPVLDTPNGVHTQGGGAGKGAGWPLEWCGALRDWTKCEEWRSERGGLLAFFVWLLSWGVWICKRGREEEKNEKREEKRDEQQMTKEERARRKAEERLQAKLEREQLEAEEEKQRQEVARLVEERRRERDQKLQMQREGEREAEKERERERRQEQEAHRRKAEKLRERQKAAEKENDKKPARSSSGEIDKTARITPLVTTRESKDKPARPVNGTAVPNLASSRSPPVHLKSDVDAKTRAGIVKNGPVINVRTVQAKMAAAARANQSVPGVKPPAVGPSTGNAWANGPLPAVRKSVAAQQRAVQPPGSVGTSGSSNASESGGSGSAWFGSAWSTPWAKVAAAGTEAMGQVSSPVPKTPTAPQPGRSWHSLFTRQSAIQLDNPPFQDHPPSPYSQSPVGSPFGRSPASSPPPQESSFRGPGFSGVWGNGSTVFTPADLQRPAPVGSRTIDPLQRLADNPWGTGVNSRVSVNGHVGSSVNEYHQPNGVNESYQPWEESSSASNKWRMWDTPTLEEVIHTSAQLARGVPPLQNGGPLAVPSRPLSADSIASSASSWSYRHSQATPPLDGVAISPSNIRTSTPSSVSLPASLSPRSPPHGEDSLNLPKTLSPLSAPLSPTRSLPTSLSVALPETLNPEPELIHTVSPTLLKPAKVLSALPASAVSAPPFIPESMSSTSAELADALARAHAHAQLAPAGGAWSDHISRVETARSVWEEADREHIMVPPEFVDCITQEVMVDPVITADGHSYERSAIEVWLRHHDTSPMTGEVLPPHPGQESTGVDKTLRPNHILRGQIIEYRERLARGAKERVAQQAGWGSTSNGTNSERPRLGLFLHNDQGVW